MSAVLMEKYSAPSTQQLLAKTAFVDPRYKDIDISDEVKDELMEEMMNVPARKYMTICATSIPSERVFSAAGNVVTSFRASLKPDKVNMLVFLAKNMKAGM